ncbi:hypothetical protein L3X38_032342 [Prunus dulcis]|uniref:Uncharacterized protein n=1 Tax=Prunus dulcis TaxID=3755 RepID=A0AAD4VDZ0_PRUDU|nr:hypothetical protein L3X38_032342 [Prunus dulcis]
MQLRLTNGPLRPARNAARVDLVSLRPVRIAAQVLQICEDCGSSRLGVSEACEDGIDGINGIDGSRMGLRLGGENFSFEMFLN